MSRLRSKTVVLSAVFMASIPILSACGEDKKKDTAEVCMDAATEIRLDDSQCDDGSGDDGDSWVYVYGTVSAVGSRLAKGSYSSVKTGTVGRAPAGGGTAASSGG